MRHVAAGSHLTVAVTTGGRVFQMGATGASGPLKHCPWEGATLPELVRGQLSGGLAGLVVYWGAAAVLFLAGDGAATKHQEQDNLPSGILQPAPASNAPTPTAPLHHPPTGHFIDEVSCGMHHVVAVGRPLDRRTARPAEHAPRAVFAWGRGSEGQLGVRSFEDSMAPLLVDALKGRPVLQVRRHSKWLCWLLDWLGCRWRVAEMPTCQGAG